MKDPRKLVSEKPVKAQETPQDPPVDSRFYRKIKGKPARIQLTTGKAVTVIIEDWDKYALSGTTKEGTPFLIYKHSIMFIYPVSDEGGDE